MGSELLFKDFEQRLVDIDIFSALKHTHSQNKEICIFPRTFYLIRAKLVFICDLDHNDQAQDNDLDG